MSCVLIKPFPRFSCLLFHSPLFSHPSPKPLPIHHPFLLLWLILAAMAPLVNGAAVYRRRHTWLGISGAFGWCQRPRWIGWRAHWRLSPGRFRGKYGGATRLWGKLGIRSPPAPAQPKEIQVQRQQQARPLACCWRVSNRAAQFRPPVFSYLFNIYLLCVPELYSSFLPVFLPTLAFLAHLPSRGKMTYWRHKYTRIFPDQIMFVTIFLTSQGQGCCTQTQVIMLGDKEG